MYTYLVITFLLIINLYPTFKVLKMVMDYNKQMTMDLIIILSLTSFLPLWNIFILSRFRVEE